MKKITADGIIIKTPVAICTLGKESSLSLPAYFMNTPSASVYVSGFLRYISGPIKSFHVPLNTPIMMKIRIGTDKGR